MQGFVLLLTVLSSCLSFAITDSLLDGVFQLNTATAHEITEMFTNVVSSIKLQPDSGDAWGTIAAVENKLILISSDLVAFTSFENAAASVQNIEAHELEFELYSMRYINFCNFELSKIRNIIAEAAWKADEATKLVAKPKGWGWLWGWFNPKITDDLHGLSDEQLIELLKSPTSSVTLKSEEAEQLQIIMSETPNSLARLAEYSKIHEHSIINKKLPFEIKGIVKSSDLQRFWKSLEKFATSRISALRASLLKMQRSADRIEQIAKVKKIGFLVALVGIITAGLYQAAPYRSLPNNAPSMSPAVQDLSQTSGFTSSNSAPPMLPVSQ